MPTNITEFTVSELSFALKRTVEENFEHVRVRGEVSGFKGAVGSGHCYFRLKDDRACLEAVIWKTALARMRFKPQEGLEMVATGKLTTYPGRSNYQIVVEQLEPAGEGALMALLEERRRKLQAEGLFDAARKRPIPYLPHVIGVVTSPTGAVIRDILHRLRERFPTHVLIWPVRVQGDGAADEVAAAIRGFNALLPQGAVPRPDLLIVARGGGSIEDLWAFNEEVAVRAVSQSGIPVIAAVGHETDWTLIDHAADLRAPTPTGAAEMAVPVHAELMAALRELSSRHELTMRRKLDAERRHYLTLCRALPGLAALVALPRQRFDEAAGRLGRSLRVEVAVKRRGLAAMAVRLTPALVARAHSKHRELLNATTVRLIAARHTTLRQARREAGQVGRRLEASLAMRIVQRHRDRFSNVDRLLATLRTTVSPEAILRRGYALVYDSLGSPVRAAAQVGIGDALRIQLAAGTLDAVVGKHLHSKRTAKSSKAGSAAIQGNLI